MGKNICQFSLKNTDIGAWLCASPAAISQMLCTGLPNAQRWPDLDHVVDNASVHVASSTGVQTLVAVGVRRLQHVRVVKSVAIAHASL